MVAATVYGVAQLLVLSTPTRSIRVTTVLLAIAVGVYGCGAATALLEYAYTRAVAEQPDGRALREAVERASYTVDPVLEEVVKVAPLLLVAGSRKLRRQWGLTDHVVTGGALGAGFGLLEAVSRYGLDADRATEHSAGGWLIPTSLTPPYIPGPDQVFSAWFPAPFGTLDLGATHPVAETSQHLVFSALCGLGVGILVRGRRWLRLAGLLPIGAACAQHLLVNYSAAHRSDRDIQAWVADTDAVLWVVPLLCLAIAIGVDLGQSRRAKRALPGVLIGSERAGRVGLEALGGYGLWRLPWSMLIALRFARMRRALLYGVDRGPYPGAETLYRTVAWSARQIDASDHLHAWRGIGVRSTWRAARAMRDGRRVWFVAVSLALMAPAALFLLVGSFPATASLQNRFETGNGPAVLMGFGMAAFVWIAWQLIDMLRTWRVTGMFALAEARAVVRFRLCTALGALTAGAVLLGRMSQEGLSPDDKVIRNVHLLDALDNFLAYLGFAMLLLALLALFPPGGGLALAGTGAMRALTVEAATHATAFGVLGVVLMSAGTSGSGPPGETRNAWPREKRKGKTKPEHRADIKGDEGRNGSHTIERHVEKSTRDMRKRLRSNPGLAADSRFINRESAQRFTDETLMRHQQLVRQWLAGTRSKLALPEVQFGERTGLSLTRDGYLRGEPPSWVNKVKVILKRDPTAASGYRVLTSYPIP